MLVKTILNRNSGGGQGAGVSNIGPVAPEFAAVGNSIDDLLAGDTDGAIWSGATGGAGYSYANLYYPIQTALVTQMGYYCTQTASDPLGSVKLGIYEEATGNLIAETAAAPLSGTGGKFPNLITPVELQKATAYYLALACNENAARFLLQSNKWSGAGLPSISFEMPNKLIPANYGLDFSNKRNFRFAIGAF